MAIVSIGSDLCQISRIEDVLELGGGQRNPGIANPEMNEVTFGPRFDDDAMLFWRSSWNRLQGVREQAQHHMAQQPRIPRHRGDRRKIALEPSSRFSFASNDRQDRFDHGAQIGR